MHSQTHPDPATTIGGTGPADPTPTAVDPPRLEGRRARLRPVGPADYGFVSALELDPEVHFRWRHRGATPSPERLISSLWDGALAVFLVEHRPSDTPVGLVVSYQPDFRAGTCSVGLVAAPHLPPGPNPILDGLALLIDYLFEVWPFRKLYAEVAGFNYAQFAAAVPLIFAEEGRLSGHDFYQGRYWDKHLLALSRPQWQEVRTWLMPAIIGPTLVSAEAAR